MATAQPDWIARTREWIRGFVIGLELCPFAQRVFDAELIRFALAEARDEAELSRTLQAELGRLVSSPREEVETTILIVPHALADFLDFNDFMAEAEDIVARLGLEGIVQVAGFHPDYRFEGTEPDDVENYTNRSPFPMLHLLREESITEVSENEEALLAIPERNIATLRGLGMDEVLKRLHALGCREGGQPGKEGGANGTAPP